MRVLAFVALLAADCGGTTGSGLVNFLAEASGPSDASDGTLSFTSGFGADVTLTRARLHIGALYLNQSVPTSGAAAEPCVSPGTYVAEVFGPLDVDLLSPAAQRFPETGEGTHTAAKTGEVWLTGGDVNALEDSTVILDVAGTAIQDAVSYPFSAALTIGSNRTPAVSNSALPGANPICHQRIVTPILVDITPTDTGTLELHIDPRPIFDGVDFSLSNQVSDAPPSYRIADTSTGAGAALFKGMRANFGVYAFSWRQSRP